MAESGDARDLKSRVLKGRTGSNPVGGIKKGRQEFSAYNGVQGEFAMRKIISSQIKSAQDFGFREQHEGRWMEDDRPNPGSTYDLRGEMADGRRVSIEQNIPGSDIGSWIQSIQIDAASYREEGYVRLWFQNAYDDVDTISVPGFSE